MQFHLISFQALTSEEGLCNLETCCDKTDRFSRLSINGVDESSSILVHVYCTRKDDAQFAITHNDKLLNTHAVTAAATIINNHHNITITTVTSATYFFIII